MRVKNLFGGAAVAQIVSLFTFPIITRLYQPNDYGAIASYIALVTTVAPLMALRYDIAVSAASNNREALYLYRFASMLVTANGALITALLIIGLTLNGTKSIDQASLFYLCAFPISVVVAGKTANYLNLAIRHGHYDIIALQQVASALVTSFIQIVGHYHGYLALLAGQILGQIVGLSILAYQLASFYPRGRTEWKRTLSIARKNINFLRFGLLGNIINLISWQLPIFFLTTAYSPYAVGVYALAMRLIQIPASIVGASFSQIYLSRAPGAATSQKLEELTGRMLNRLLRISIGPAIVVFFVAPSLIGAAFGSKWTDAGYIVQILTPWALIWFVSTPLSQVFALTGRHDRELQAHVIIFASRLLGIICAYWFENMLTAIAVMTIGTVLGYVWLLSQILQISGERYWHTILQQMRPAIDATITLGVATGMIYFGVEELYAAAAAVAIIAVLTVRPFLNILSEFK